tara:strand:- start:527 stop:1240 length:714 start_codon:yes stop_codon:yes gene_type:complete
MEKAKKIKIILGIIYFLIVSIFLWYFFTNFSMDEVTSYEFIKKNRDLLLTFKEKNFFWIILVFLFITVIWVLLLGFGSPIGLIGGFVFGKWTGTLIVSISLTIGATIMYLFANFFLKELIKEKFEKKFINFIEKFKKNEFLYFFIYRFVGGIPFFIANILPSLFSIKIKNYFFGTLFGIIPSVFIFVSLGDGLQKIINENIEAPSFFHLLSSQEIYIPILAFLLLMIISFFIKKKLD